MLSFKQYLIEKTEDTKYGGMNVPLDLADFPDDDSGSMISPLNFSGTALNPVKYTRTDRDAYDAALKLKNEKILANNQKFGLSDDIDETPFEKAFDNTRKYIESTVMDPDNKENMPRSPDDMSSSVYKRADTVLPDLGEKGWLGSLLNPDNPLDSQSAHTRTVSAIKNVGPQISKGWTDFNSWLGRQDPPREMLDPNYSRMKKLSDPIWIAHNEAGEKEARNARLGVTPSVVNPNKSENYHDSQDYFDRITGIAQTQYDNEWYRADEKNRKLSPFDMISLQFGKDNSKDRNEFLEKQKEYLDRRGSRGIDYVPWWQSKEAKMARTYADLRDPRHDEEMLYKPVDLETFSSKSQLSKTINPPETFLGKTKLKNPDLYTSQLFSFMNDIADPDSITKRIQKHNDPGGTPLTPGQEAGRAIDNQMVRIPSTFETKIDMNKDNIQDFDQFIATLGHEGQHASVTQARAIANIENTVSTKLGKDPEYKSPATIKYGIEPSISGLKLGSGYEELEQRGILDSWKVTPEQKAAFKTELEKFDAPTPSPNNRSKTPDSYLWSRIEMPAYMTDIKGQMLKSTGSYPKSDQTDEQIEQDRDRMYEIIRQNGPGGDFAKLKALEFMKTPEGKAIYRGVEKASPKQDRQYA